MTKTKKILCVLFASIIAVASILTIPLINNKVSADDMPTSTWASQATEALTENTKTGAYEISSVQQLAYFNENLSTYASSTIHLVANLDMSGYRWVPKSVNFTGTFDGLYHTISNLLIYPAKDEVERAGLFYTIKDGTVSNLTLVKPKIVTAYKLGGTVAGLLQGGTISNCIVKAREAKNSKIITYGNSSSDTVYCGGLVGRSTGGTITNCFLYNLDIQPETTPAATYIGGIVGGADDTASIELSFAKFTGTYFGPNGINATSSTYSCAGGIVGLCENSEILKCFYSGYRVLAHNTTKDDSDLYAGGICGYSTESSISYCYNTADVTAKEEATADEITLSKITTTEIPGDTDHNCWYFCDGTVNSHTTKHDGKNSGTYAGSTSTSTFTSQKYIGNAGGILGKGDTNTKIDSCYNTKSNISGGKNTYKYKIYVRFFEKSYWRSGFLGIYANEGNEFSVEKQIECSEIRDYAGGIQAWASAATVTNCYSPKIERTNDPETLPPKFDVYFDLEGEGSKKINLSFSFGSTNRNLLKPLILTCKYDSSLNWSPDTYTLCSVAQMDVFGNESLTSNTVSDIEATNNSVWIIVKGVNNSNPILRELYWEY